jgi:hypothetical protein
MTAWHNARKTGNGNAPAAAHLKLTGFYIKEKIYAQQTLKIGGAKFHIKCAISEMGRAKFREILISGAQFANFPVWLTSYASVCMFQYMNNDN